MTDVIDVAQRRQAEDIEQALSARRFGVADLPVRTHCVNADCGEAITPVRQRIHAQLCIDCQRDAERDMASCLRGAI